MRKEERESQKSIGMLRRRKEEKRREESRERTGGWPPIYIFSVAPQ
jgi:hypothetical protein